MTTSNEERPRVLIVDDEKFIRDILADFLGMEGYVVRTAEDGAGRARASSNHAHYDLVISDLKMPRMGGIELLEQIGNAAPNALTVIMTGFGTVETAIDAMKRGAYDYILKPFKVEEVIHVVQRGLEKQRLAAENLRLQGGALALQGERGDRREPLARGGPRDGRRHGDPRDPRRPRRRPGSTTAKAATSSASGSFRRSTSAAGAMKEAASFGTVSTRARSSSTSREDSTLLEHGREGACASSQHEPERPGRSR